MVWKLLPVRVVLAIIAIAIVVFPAVFATNYAMDDTRFLASEAVEQGAAATASANPFDLGTEAQESETARTELLREKARTTLATWVVLAGGASLIFATLWLLFARRAEQGVAGPAGQQGQKALWIVLLVANLIAIGGIGYYLSREPDALPLNAIGIYGASALLGLIGLLSFWLATAVAASRVMRASVPLGHLNPAK